MWLAFKTSYLWMMHTIYNIMWDRIFSILDSMHFLKWCLKPEITLFQSSRTTKTTMYSHKMNEKKNEFKLEVSRSIERNSAFGFVNIKRFVWVSFFIFVSWKLSLHWFFFLCLCLHTTQTLILSNSLFSTFVSFFISFASIIPILFLSFDYGY